MTKPIATLVIPGKNCGKTIGACLDAVTPMLGRLLTEIVFVNDASTDDTAEIVGRYPVRVVTGRGRGPGAARNLGWRAANTPWIWFIDSDCVAEKDALERLLSRANGPEVAGVGGSYGNMSPDSLLACLIHEEIVARHASMPAAVDFLGSFNVLYRRAALAEVRGFDETYVTAEDADLSFRLREAGYELGFAPESRVRHFHPTDFGKYLKTQAKHGYYRALLYDRHPGRAAGDSYSGFSDHVQPALALGSLALAPFAPLVAPALLQIPIAAGLAAAQVPMTARILGKTRDPKLAAFAPMSYARAYARAAGFAVGAVRAARERLFGEKSR